MAKIYRHKKHGYQLVFTVYFPSGDLRRSRYSRSKDEADEMLRIADMVERSSRRCDISPRELQLAVNYGLLDDDEAAILSGTERKGNAGETTLPDKLVPVLSRLKKKRGGEWVFGGDLPIVPNRLYKTHSTHRTSPAKSLDFGERPLLDKEQE